MVTAADASPELVELGEAEALGAFDHHDGGVGDIDADFDDGGGDQDVELAIAEGVHDGGLGFVLEAAVEEADALGEPGEDIGAEAGEFGFGGANLQGVGFFDEGEDDEYLAAGGDLLADEGEGPGALLGGDESGLDGAATGGHFGDATDVEVAVDGEGEGAGDGGGGHDEDVGIDAHAAHAGALVDAETVLLIDDDEAEAGELGFVGDEGLGADDDVDFAGGDALPGFAAFGFGEGAGDEFDGDILISKDFVEGGQVLLGQELGGSHDGGLESGADAGEKGAGGDDGLAGADIALEETVHGDGLLDVVEDVADGVALVAGELEGQGAGEIADGFARDPDRLAGAAFTPVAAALEDAELQQEELVEGEALDGGGGGGRGLGKVDVAQGAAGADEAGAAENLGGQEIDDERGAALDDFASPEPQHLLGELAGGRVDGDLGAGVQGTVEVEFEIGGAELGSVAAPVGAAEKGDVAAALQGPLEVGLVEPDGGDGVAAVGEDGAGDGADAAAGAAAGELDDIGDNVDGLAGANLADGGEVGTVEVFAGEVVKEVLVSGDVEFGEELFVPGADAEEVGDGGVEFARSAARTAGLCWGRITAGFGRARLAGFCRGRGGGEPEGFQGGGDGGGAGGRVESRVVEQGGEFGRQTLGLEVLLEAGDEAGEAAGDGAVGEVAVALEFEDPAEGVESGGAAGLIRVR